jgi:glucan endo-1,3-beta-D-glucosidase
VQQAGTSNTPISAIPAAISTKTSLLLGLWASAGEAAITNEIQALLSAIEQYGTDFTSLVAGISVGSEDLYRISPTGILNKENPGADPSTLVGYINQVREAIASTSLSSAPIGHVDTWTAWVNGSNQAVIDAADWIGVDAYPYFETTLANDITNNKALFNDALSQTKAAVGGKPVWITETGYPVSGSTAGQAVPSLENAKTYWDEVGCPLFGSVNTWWYTMQDASPTTPNPSFGIVGSDLTTTPLYDLSCNSTSYVPTSSSIPSPPPTACH